MGRSVLPCSVNRKGLRDGYRIDILSSPIQELDRKLGVRIDRLHIRMRYRTHNEKLDLHGPKRRGHIRHIQLPKKHIIIGY